MVLDQSDILVNVSAVAPIKDSFIKKGEFERCPNGDLKRYVGGFTIVFPVVVNGEKYAFRCWHVFLDSMPERFEQISQGLSSRKLRYFVDFEYVEEGLYVGGQIYPTTRMKWIEGLNLKEYIVNKQNDEKALSLLAKRFCEMMLDLHRMEMAHGDLQHENIIVDSSGELRLVDYDSLYLPEMSGNHPIDEIAGKPDYQHPNRKDNKYASGKLDYFSELTILISILGVASSPSLASKYKMEDSDSLLFRKEDYLDLKSSEIYRDLSKLGGVFEILLYILCKYLESDDINKLNPLEYELKSRGYTLFDLIEEHRKTLQKPQSPQMPQPLQMSPAPVAPQMPQPLQDTSTWFRSHRKSVIAIAAAVVGAIILTLCLISIVRHSSTSPSVLAPQVDGDLIAGNYSLRTQGGFITTASVECVRDGRFAVTVFSKYKPYSDTLSISREQISLDSKSQTLTISLNLNGKDCTLTKYLDNAEY